MLFSIAGGPDLTLTEVSDAARTIELCADENANIIYGQIIDENMKDAVRITVIATGFNNAPAQSSMTFGSRIPQQESFPAAEQSYSTPSAAPMQAAPTTFSPHQSGGYADEDYIPDFLKRQ